MVRVSGTCPGPRDVQQHMGGSQFNFGWLPARASRHVTPPCAVPYGYSRRGAWPPNEIKKNTPHPEDIRADVCDARVERGRGEPSRALERHYTSGARRVHGRTSNEVVANHSSPMHAGLACYGDRGRATLFEWPSIRSRLLVCTSTHGGGSVHVDGLRNQERYPLAVCFTLVAAKVGAIPFQKFVSFFQKLRTFEWERSYLLDTKQVPLWARPVYCFIVHLRPPPSLPPPPRPSTCKGTFSNASVAVNSGSAGSPPARVMRHVTSHPHVPHPTATARVVPDRLTKSRRIPTRKQLPLL